MDERQSSMIMRMLIKGKITIDDVLALLDFPPAPAEFWRAIDIAGISIGIPGYTGPSGYPCYRVWGPNLTHRIPGDLNIYRVPNDNASHIFVGGLQGISRETDYEMVKDCTKKVIAGDLRSLQQG